MKAIFLIALLAITASASLQDNKCFMEKAGSAVASVASTIKQMNNFESLDQYESMMTQIAELKAAYTFCNISSSSTSNNLDSVLENLGVGNLLLSQCTQDLGGFFLILESIVSDPSDITNDIIGGLFGLMMGQKAYGECGQFLAFIN